MLDIYHAKQRVTKTLARSHPDYVDACRELTFIFGQLKIESTQCKYKNEEEFKKALLSMWPRVNHITFVQNGRKIFPKFIKKIIQKALC